MSVNIMVVINGSDLGEEVLKESWKVAQTLFREYDIKVFIIPYFNPKGNVALIVNGIEFLVKRKPSEKELIDMILSAITMGVEEEDNLALGAIIHGDDLSFGSAAIAS